MQCLNPYTLPEIQFVGGSTQDLFFHVFYYIGKKPFSLNGCECDFAIVDFADQLGDPIIEKQMTISSGSGDYDDNTISVTLEPLDTVNLYGRFIYQITIRSSAGKVEIPNRGIINIVNNINKELISN